KIVADSVSEIGDRLTTMEVTFPRMVLAEFNTHRAFSRNSASSRAIPVEKQLQRIMDDPFVPVWWGRKQSGMQADYELEGHDREQAEAEWLAARNSAVSHVQRLLELGLHKQITNRLLEPFMWHTVIVTATEWSNFFALRANPMAQPEIRVIAEMMRDLYAESKPMLVKYGEWHLPLIQPEERDGEFEFSENARKISAARCARVSYLTHDGKRDLEADLKLYDRLASAGHMSPFEHVATPFEQPYIYRRENVMAEYGDGYMESSEQVKYLLAHDSGNFRGWKQLRKFLPNESDFSKVNNG
ncbi:hypothetical protein B7Z17_02715, partial [Candidatus Saccharibacteria bacterium 32-49-10]